MSKSSDAFWAGVIVGGGIAGYYGGKAIYRCLISGSSTSGPPSDEFATKVAQALITKRQLRPDGSNDSAQQDRHRLFFIRRRARELGFADASLQSGAGLQTLTDRIDQQVDQVDAFLVKRLGTSSNRGPYFGGPGGPVGPGALLDLGAYVDPHVGGSQTTEKEAREADAPDVTQSRTLHELDRRRMRVQCIVWRAAAIHSNVWGGSPNDLKIKEEWLILILDRRLMAVERLFFEVSAGATAKGMGSSNIDREFVLLNNKSTKEGFWRDKFRVRCFEAPSLPRDARDADDDWVAADFFPASGDLVSDAGVPRYNLGGGGRGWYFNFASQEFDRNTGNGTQIWGDADGWRAVPSTLGSPGYGWILQAATLPPPSDGSTPLPPKKPAEVIGELFAPVSTPPPPPDPPQGQPKPKNPPNVEPPFNRVDWWDRSWLHSDGIMSALQIEALRHAHVRRKVPGGERPDDTFNGLIDKFSVALDDYFQVRLVDSAPNGIMAGKNDFFENGTIPADDLQIGDQVLFETSPVLVAVGSTAWDYPTVLVTDVDTTSAPGKTGVDLARLRVQGFNTAEVSNPEFQLLLATTVDATLKGIQDFIPFQIARLKAAAQPGTTFTPPEKLSWDIGILTANDRLLNDTSILRLWNPYGDQWDDPGPWWIWINTRAPIWKGRFGADGIQALKTMPGGIVWIAKDKVQVENSTNRWRKTGAPSIISVGPGFQEPPWEDFADEDAVTDQKAMVFVPLFEPFGGWESYFDAKVQFPNDSKWPSKLDPVKSDARWVSGFAKDPADSTKVRVIRPLLPAGLKG